MSSARDILGVLTTILVCWLVFSIQACRGGNGDGGAAQEPTGTLLVSRGSATPGDPTQNWMIPTNYPSLVVFQFSLTESSRREDIRVTSIKFTEDNASTVAANILPNGVSLWRDTNDNGRLDRNVDVQIGSASYSGDVVTFSGLNERIGLGLTENYLLVYRLTGQGTAGDRLRARIAAPTDISAVGVTSGSGIPVTLNASLPPTGYYFQLYDIFRNPSRMPEQPTAGMAMWLAWIAAADFNRDGDPDLCAVDNGRPTGSATGLSVSFGTGEPDGELNNPATYRLNGTDDTNEFPWPVGVTDFERDGDLDIVVAANGPAPSEGSPWRPRIWLMRNNGSGVFSLYDPTTDEFGSYEIGNDTDAVRARTGPRALAVCDFDGNGFEDILIASRGTDIAPGNRLVFFRNNGYDTNPDVDGWGWNAQSWQGLKRQGDFVVGNAASPNVTRPIALAVGDFNGDGRDDIIVGFEDSNVLEYYQGDGTFTPTTTRGRIPTTGLSTTADPVWMATADFDHNGLLDFAVTWAGEGLVSVFLNDGSWNFTRVDLGFGVNNAAQPGFGLYWVVADDFDKDGHKDIAVSCWGSSRPGVEYWLGAGDKTFGRSRYAPIPTGITLPMAPTGCIAPADFDKDGYIDLAVAWALGDTGTAENDPVLLYRNRTLPSPVAGAYRSPVTPKVTPNPTDIVVADFNRDGTSDFAVVCVVPAAAGSPNLEYRVRVGIGRPGRDIEFNILPEIDTDVFAGPVTPTPPRTMATGKIAAGNFNGDGNGFIDLVIAADDGDETTVDRFIFLPGNGDGTFDAPGVHQLTAGTGPVSVATGRFNGDAADDFAIACDDTGTTDGDSDYVITVLGGGTFTQTGLNMGPGRNPNTLAIGLINADGNLDIVVTNAGTDGLYVFYGNGAGGFPGTDDGFTRARGYVGLDPTGVAVGFLNDDANGDVVVGNYSETPPTLSVLLGRSTTPYDFSLPNDANGTIVRLAGKPIAVRIGDYNEDGVNDVITLYSGGGFGLALGRGDGTFPGEATNFTLGGGGVTALGIGDFNADAALDVAAPETAGLTSAGVVNVAAGYAPSVFGTAISYSAGNSPSSVSVADQDRDGKLDVAVANRGSADIIILRGDGMGNLSITRGLTVSASGMSPSSVELVDYTRDGRLDLIVGNGASGTSALRTWAATPAYTYPALSNIDWAYPIDAFACGDINNDGWVDVVAVSRSGNRVGVFRNRRGALPPFELVTTIDPTAIGATGRTNVSDVRLVDHDRDGDLDAVVCFDCQNSGVLVIWNDGPSSYALGGSGTFWATPPFARAVATGDFDMDGHVDVAVACRIENIPGVPAQSGVVRIFRRVGGTITHEDLAYALVQADSARGLNASAYQPSSMHVFDFDGDGDLELIISNRNNSDPQGERGGGALSILRNRRTTTPVFVSFFEVVTGFMPNAVRTGDIRIDGKPDAVVPLGSTSGSVSLHMRD